MYTNDGSDNSKQQINMWYCVDCNSIDFRVGAVMLHFTREEFSELINACVEIYCDEFGILSELNASHCTTSEEDTLSSELIS